MTRVTDKPTDPRCMFDEQVAAFLGISCRTLWRRLEQPIKGEINPNDAEPRTIGNRRIWLREKVERLVGIEATKEQER